MRKLKKFMYGTLLAGFILLGTINIWASENIQIMGVDSGCYVSRHFQGIFTTIYMTHHIRCYPLLINLMESFSPKERVLMQTA